MSYQVLARKWRPKSFKEIVGQAHVVRAISHALDQQRLHHAYLFTGTRGVGKTTLSRILAKSLNCETGITSTPCGQCSACISIDKGGFIDYVELDAASNRGVDDMTSLLEQAVYAPTQGRFKVYMLDEVHQLTGHAFNAMLKTLEEPPAHVKFILATTDPQKVPVTVLSRCLQFNLKQMSGVDVAGHLAHVLTQEQIAFEPAALQLIGRASAGSMRDALSLLDQAIAYGGNSIKEAEVRNMLGAIDQTYLFDLLRALAHQDGASLMQHAHAMESRSLSFDAALNDLAFLLHHIAIAQTVPNALGQELPEREAIIQLAQQIHPETIQLYYQIAILGRRDLGLAPDEFAGFTMCLLRMLAFNPQQQTQSSANIKNTPNEVASKPISTSASQALAALTKPPTTAEKEDTPSITINPVKISVAATTAPIQPSPIAEQPTVEPHELSMHEKSNANSGLQFDGNWRGLVDLLKLGLARSLAENCELERFDANNIYLKLAQSHQHLLDFNYQDKLKAVIAQHFDAPIKLHFSIGSGTNTPAAQIMEEKAEIQSKAVDAIQSDPFVQALVKDFQAQIVPSSIKPIQ